MPPRPSLRSMRYRLPSMWPAEKRPGSDDDDEEDEEDETSGADFSRVSSLEATQAILCD